MARDGITGALVLASIFGTTTVTATASGYLVREQPTAPVLWLWPQAPEYVGPFLYTSAATGSTTNLYRWPDGSMIRMAFAPGLTRHQAVLQEAASEVSRVSRLAVLVLDPGDRAANVTLSVDPGSVPAGFAAYARFTASSWSVNGGTVAFRRESDIENNSWFNLTLHELGHVLGAGHSPNTGDTMSALAGRRNKRNFGTAESRAFTMTYVWRKAGNQFPDREPVGLQSTRPTMVEVACGE